MPLKDSRSGAGRSVVAVLTLACVTAITVDYQGGRLALRAGPRSGSATLSARSRRARRSSPARCTTSPASSRPTRRCAPTSPSLEAENSNLRGQLATTSEVRYRAAELDGLLAASRTTGFALVPARVVAMGPAQSFSRTVTIDAGTSSGIHPT